MLITAENPFHGHRPVMQSIGLASSWKLNAITQSKETEAEGITGISQDHTSKYRTSTKKKTIATFKLYLTFSTSLPKYF